MIREAIAQVAAGTSLGEADAAAAMEEIMTGVATPSQLGAFLTALRIKGETVEEVTGLARVMRAQALHVPLPPQVRALDTCGTGGDASGTFNVSTAAGLLVAALGQPVAKHGNRAATSRCGSADVLEALGRSGRKELLASLDPDTAADALEEMEPDELTALLREMEPDQAAGLVPVGRRPGYYRSAGGATGRWAWGRRGWSGWGGTAKGGAGVGGPRSSSAAGRRPR